MHTTHLMLMYFVLMGGTCALAQTSTAPAHGNAAKTQRNAAAHKPNTSAAHPNSAEHELSVHQLAIASQVHTGQIQCELGQTISLQPDPKSPGRFNLSLKPHTYHLTPVQSATGAIRLEDPKSGAVWIQLADKSMLMNSKLGQRLADVCQSPEQLQVAESQKTNPPPNLLDPSPSKGWAQK